MASIKEVAKEAGVSVATVSKILNYPDYSKAETRERVMATIKRLNYQPNHAARSMVNKRTGMIALIIPDVRNPFFTEVARGVEDAANKNNYRVMLCNTDEDPKKQQNYLQALQSRMVDGFIIAVASDDCRQLKKIDRRQLPFVFIDRECRDYRADAVIVDNRDGALKAVRHLLGNGRRRVGFISGKRDTQTGRERLQGYREALTEAGIGLNPEMIKDGQFTCEGGYQAAKALLVAADRPDALFVANNAMTIGVIRALTEARLRIPEEMALVCFDDAAWAEFFTPALTVIRQPTYTMGSLAGEILFQRIFESQPSEIKEIVLKPELVARRSCGSN
ncbi:MAG: LacI family DNA-binding transcriptional regulator [Bacillota bacterium]|jgi:DNA-binding LacI/PurR family transcriptional regulator